MHKNIDAGKLGTPDIEALVFNIYNGKEAVKLGLRDTLPMMLDFKKIPYVNTLPFFGPISNVVVKHTLMKHTKKTVKQQDDQFNKMANTIAAVEDPK